MNKSFAVPFLKKLQTKLETLDDSPDAERADTERNLFNEFFKKSFTKTLSLVAENLKTEFVDQLKSSVTKFTAHRQLLIAVLISVLENGKDHEDTHKALAHMVEETLRRFDDPLEIPSLVEDVGHETFHRMIDSLSLEAKADFIDMAMDAMLRVEEKNLKACVAAVPAISSTVTVEVSRRTTELNDWMRTAPRFPATPLALCDILTGLRDAKVTQLFQACADEHKKERFEVALSLVISCALAFRQCSLGNRLSWISVAAPDMRAIALDLQTRFGAESMDDAPSLVERLKRYNDQAKELFPKLLQESTTRDVVKQQIMNLLPPRVNVNQVDEAWVDVDSVEHQLARRIWNALVTRVESTEFPPEHTLQRDTLVKVLRTLPAAFEMDEKFTKVRLGAKLVGMQPREVRAAVQNVTQFFAEQAEIQETQKESSREEDTLVDNLLREALEGVDNLDYIKARRVSLGVYEFQSKTVTFIVKNGQLYVYRVGNEVRQIPIVMWLNQEIHKAQAMSPKKDNNVTKSGSTSWPFGVDDRRDQEAPRKNIALPDTVNGMSKEDATVSIKRVTAASRASELNRRLIRRSISWDEDTLRKLMKVGLKKDMVWRESWNFFCQSSGWCSIEERLPKTHTHETLTRFIEANLGEVLGRDWLKEFLVDEEVQEGPRRRDREKELESKRKKRKKDKKKKRKLSSGSSDDGDEDNDDPITPEARPLAPGELIPAMLRPRPMIPPCLPLLHQPPPKAIEIAQPAVVEILDDPDDSAVRKRKKKKKERKIDDVDL